MKTYLSELIWMKREIKNRGPTLRLTSNTLLGRITAPQRCHVLSLRTSEYVVTWQQEIAAIAGFKDRGSGHEQAGSL